MSKIKIEIHPIYDSKNEYIYDIDFEIDEEEVSMCIYDDEKSEHRTISFEREDFKKIQKIIEVTE